MLVRNFGSRGHVPAPPFQRIGTVPRHRLLGSLSPGSTFEAAKRRPSVSPPYRSSDRRFFTLSDDAYLVNDNVTDLVRRPVEAPSSGARPSDFNDLRRFFDSRTIAPQRSEYKEKLQQLRLLPDERSSRARLFIHFYRSSDPDRFALPARLSPLRADAITSCYLVAMSCGIFLQLAIKCTILSDCPRRCLTR